MHCNQILKNLYWINIWNYSMHDYITIFEVDSWHEIYQNSFFSLSSFLLLKTFPLTSPHTYLQHLMAKQLLHLLHLWQHPQCLPYSSEEESILSRKVLEIPWDPSFVLHMGNMTKPKVKNCMESAYSTVQRILLTCPKPVFISLGNNDCPNIDQHTVMMEVQ